jgi:hypothetical protein
MTTMQTCVKEKIEFAKLLVSRPIDPLAAAWLSLNAHCCDRIHIACDLLDIRRDALVTPTMVIHIFRQQSRTDIADMGFDTRGIKLGLWTMTHLRPFHTILPKRLIYGKLTRSNEFIERTASYAFLCMYVGVKTGRDIACTIARKVAKMYLDDYKWIANLPPYINYDGPVEKEIRERIMRWLLP